MILLVPILLSSIMSQEVFASNSKNIQHRSLTGQIVPIELEYKECVQSEGFLNNFACSWGVNAGSKYTVKLEKTTIDSMGRVNCDPGTTPDGIGVSPGSSLMGSLPSSPTEFTVEFICDESIVGTNGRDILTGTTSFCVRTDIFETTENSMGNLEDFSVAYHKTIIEVEFNLDGTFAVSGVLIEEDEAFFEDFMIMKQYTVDYYQCAIEPPHVASEYVIYADSGRNKLGICVETTMEDNMLVGVETFSLDMPPVGNSAGYQPNNNPRIENNVNVWMSAFNCDLIKPGSSEPNSMCFIETLVETAFFNNWNGNPLLKLRAQGSVDLRMRGSNMNGRALQANIDGPANFDGKYSVILPIGADGNTMFISGAMMRSTIFYTAFVVAVFFHVI